MSMKIKVQFTLHKEHADLARELQRHLRDKENLHMDLNEVVRRQFINWMYSNIDKGTSTNGHTETLEGKADPVPDSPAVGTSGAGDALLPVQENGQS